MDTKLLLILVAVILDGLAGLAGGVLPPKFVHRHIASLLAFAAGTLIAAALLEMIPAAMLTDVPGYQVTGYTLVGFMVFHAVESFIGTHAAGQSGHKHSTIGPMILVGDAIHNATDGIAIAAAFTADIRTGIAATLAVLVHELPQEIGDFSILVAHGYSRGRALFYLVLVQFSALLGAFGALWAASMAVGAGPLLTALSAGGFLYIAAADLIPELHRRTADGRPLPKFLSFCGGVALLAVLNYR